MSDTAAKSYTYAIGRRKASTAQVRLYTGGNGEMEIAAICEKLFTDDEYKNQVVADIKKFCEENTWGKLAEQYYEFVKEKVNGKTKE